MAGNGRRGVLPVRSNYVDLSAQPIVNLFKDPRALSANLVWSNGRWFGSAAGANTPAGTYAGVSNATDGPPGINSYRRKTWTVGTTTTVGDTGYDLIAATSMVPAGPGTTVTYGWWMRSSAAGKVANLSVYHVASDRTNFVHTRANVVLATLTAGAWQWITSTYTVPATYTSTAFIRVAFDIYGNASAYGTPTMWQPGDTLDATGGMIVMGSYPGLTYLDGTTAGWRWTGAANNSDSVGHPLPPNVLPDPQGMSQWSAGGGTPARIASTDPKAVPGCPLPWIWNMGQFDNKISPIPSTSVMWAPTNIGVQSWIFEGWAAAPAAVSANLSMVLRWGDRYANTGPVSDYARPADHQATLPFLAAANYRTWAPFKAFAKFVMPVGATPYLTPNWGGQDWQIAGVTMRRAVAGEA